MSSSMNEMAATTDLELNIINKKAYEMLKEAGVILYDDIVGKYCTSLEMAGPHTMFIERTGERMKEMNAASVSEMMNYVADQMIGKKDLLCEIDGKTGDGDHGMGIERGFKAVKKFLEEEQPQTVREIFGGLGMAMMNSMGGASGVIFSAIFPGILKQPEQEMPDVGLLRGMCESGLKRIKDAGGAKEGDKTMIDALAPTVRAIGESEEREIEELIKTAWKAAAQGAENTKNYTAKFGRAKFLGERSLGCEDAGAVSVSIIFQSMYEYTRSLQGGKQ